jgi:hypothetical protein
MISIKTREHLLEQARHQCTICGTRFPLELAHITHKFEGGTDASDNFIVLCSVCHDWVDRINIPPNILSEVKKAWVDQAILGRKYILWWLSDKDRNTTLRTASVISQKSFARWVEYISSKTTFDEELIRARADIQALTNEGELILHLLRPIFEFLAFEGITVLHHSGAPEHGKDMVFYQKDNLNTFIFYAVVACNTKIHTTSSKTGDSGHYHKIIDQVSKCFFEPWRDNNLKREAYIDKVVVVTSSTISDAAMTYFTRWEEKERRHLIFLDRERLASLLVQLRLGKEQEGI